MKESREPGCMPVSYDLAEWHKEGNRTKKEEKKKFRPFQYSKSCWKNKAGRDIDLGIHR